MIKRILLLAYTAALAVSLTACAGTQTKIDDTLSNEGVQSGIDLACTTYKGLKLGFDTYAASTKVSDKVKTAVGRADAGINAICTPPYPTDTTALIAKVVLAGVQVAASWNEAKGLPASAPLAADPVAPPAPE